MNQQKLREWIMKQNYFSLNPRYDGMTAWELAGIIIREGQDEVNYQYTKVGVKPIATKE